MFFVSTCEGCRREFIGSSSEALIGPEYEHYVSSYNNTNGDIRHKCCRFSINTEEDGVSVRGDPSYRMYGDWTLMRSGRGRRVGDAGGTENYEVGKWMKVPDDLIVRFSEVKKRLIRKYGA